MTRLEKKTGALGHTGETASSGGGVWMVCVWWGGGCGVSEWWSRDLTVVIGAVVEREDHAVGARLEAEVERHRCVHHHHGLGGRHLQT